MKGRLVSLERDYVKEEWKLTITSKDSQLAKDFEKLNNSDVSIELKKYRDRRSLNANAYLWKCLQEIAEAIGSDKWDVYLQMIKRYGKHIYIVVKPAAVKDFMKSWRECEIIGDIIVNGQKGVQLLCYPGSSEYDTEEMRKLINGVVSEMKDMDLRIPATEDLERAIAEWENQSIHHPS